MVSAISSHHPDQFHGLLTPYGYHQAAGTPLPMMLATKDGRPVYVNPKQYHGILRRRKARAKEALRATRVIRDKPYLHESRHLHAKRRPRGSGGRFLKSNQLQELKPNKEDLMIATTADVNNQAVLLSLNQLGRSPSSSSLDVSQSDRGNSKSLNCSDGGRSTFAIRLNPPPPYWSQVNSTTTTATTSLFNIASHTDKLDFLGFNFDPLVTTSAAFQQYPPLLTSTVVEGRQNNSHNWSFLHYLPIMCKKNA